MTLARTDEMELILMANARRPVPAVPNDANASGRSFGPDELELLKAVLDRGGLISQSGLVVPQLEKEFARWCGGVPYCVATSSGTAGLHCAFAAVDPRPGDEIITTPITDMGAVMPILYQGAIPVFADVDCRTCNVTAQTIAARITDRTRAIVVTHLFGRPVDMDPVLALARQRDLPVIEDAAQACGAKYKGVQVGTLGAIGCFSLQQGKHMTCGEGGLVVTRDERYGKLIRTFHDKGWGFDDPNPDHDFLALNYRMTELQGAVALAQLRRLDGFVQHRRSMMHRLTDQFADIDGIITPTEPEGIEHSYWRYALRVEEPLTGADLDRISEALRQIGARTAPRYTQRLAFQHKFLAERRMFGGSGFPFVGPQRAGATDPSYDPKDFPGAVDGLRRVLCIAVNEKFDEQVVDRIAAIIREAAKPVS